jgi:RNA polymerase sigma-70 factor, ECF subfamily
MDDSLVGSIPPTRDAQFEVLFTEHHVPILNYLYRLLDDAADAEELCQDVFVRAYRALARPERVDNPRAWLYRIATNCAIDRHRRKRLLSWLPFRDGDSDGRPSDDGRAGTLPTEEHGGIEGAIALQELVRRSLGALSMNDRQVLVLYAMHGHSVREIAEVLGVSEGAVKTRLCRARERFRRVYAEECGDAM